MSYTYEVEQSVPVRIVRGGVEEDARVGVSKQNGGKSSMRLFGLLHPNDPGWLTHMCYGLDYFEPFEVLQDAKTIGDGWFFFDAGTTRTEVKISSRELEVAFYKLHLIDSCGIPDADDRV